MEEEALPRRRRQSFLFLGLDEAKPRLAEIEVVEKGEEEEIIMIPVGIICTSKETGDTIIHNRDVIEDVIHL